jgi:hypothetical protein
MTETAKGVWMYAIHDVPNEDRPLSIRGVDGEPVRVVRAEGLAAVVGSVDLDRFGEQGLRESLNELGQLEQIARAHHAVVSALAQRGPVAPARLATVYQNDDGVARTLRDHHDSFTAALRRVRGRQEWGVKVYAELRTDPEPEPGPASSGTAYLRARQAALTRRERDQQAVLDGAESIFSALRPLAAATQRHRPQDHQLSGDPRWMVGNDAYLVDEERAENFQTAVAESAGRHPHLAVELTGPWPPYSFAVVQEPV